MPAAARGLVPVFVFLLCLLLSPAAPAAEPEAAIDLQQLALRIHELVNAERARQHLAPLAWDEALRDIARKHSREMADKGYLAHVNRRGEDPTERGRHGGYDCRRKSGNLIREGLAENLFQNHRYRAIHTVTIGAEKKIVPDAKTLEELAASTVAGWMASAGHRQNLLDPWHGAEGIGIAVAGDGKVYITQLFC
jgi:uncharacterized protein YkwD